MKRTKFICISGHAQNGKDTTANMMDVILSAKKDEGADVKIIHYADLLKYICKQFFGWDGEKNEFGRSLLQYVGTEKIRKKDPDYWVRFVASIASFFEDEWDYIIVPDTRFPNEVNYLKCAGFDVLHVNVVRPNFDNGLTAVQKRHPSETALDTTKPNYTIMNDGSLGDLLDKVKDLCNDPFFNR